MTTSVLEDQRTVWVIVVVSFLLFLVGNLPWQLDDYDQAKQAFTSFQMIKEGRWFYQQTPREHVATKPPLVGWVSAGLFGLTQSWELSWRLPSLLAAIALAIFLFRAASSAYRPISGLIALGAFGLNLLSPRLATLVRTDMPLALVIFLIGLLIWKKIREETEWRLRDQIYVFALLTIAMLIKGPIVYAFLLPGIVLFECFAFKERRLGQPRTVRGGKPSFHVSAWPGWWPWVASLAVFLLWVTGGILFQPGFFNEVVMREFVARFGETIHRPQPLYFYLPHLLHKFAPWSVLIIGIALVDLHSRRWRLRSAFRDMSPDTFWLLCWSVGGLILMSLIPSKRVDRIFPIIPPLCLLLAAQIGSRRSSSRSDGFPAPNDFRGCPKPSPLARERRRAASLPGHRISLSILIHRWLHDLPRSSQGIGTIATRLLFLDARFAVKRKHIAGATKSYPRRTTGYCSICRKRISLSRTMPSPNGTVASSTR